VKDVDAPTDCIGSRNTSGSGTDLEITMYSKSSVVSDDDDDDDSNNNNNNNNNRR
jgi:hypothetical protein